MFTPFHIYVQKFQFLEFHTERILFVLLIIFLVRVWK